HGWSGSAPGPGLPSDGPTSSASRRHGGPPLCAWPEVARNRLPSRSPCYARLGSHLGWTRQPGHQRGRIFGSPIGAAAPRATSAAWLSRRTSLTEALGVIAILMRSSRFAEDREAVLRTPPGRRSVR